MIKKYLIGNWMFFALMLAVMCFHFLPRDWHEIIGVIILIPLGWHLYKYRMWWKNLLLFKGRWNGFRIVNTVVDVTLLALIITVLVTGAGISHYLFKPIMPLDIRTSVPFHQHHVSFCYTLWIFIGLHVGLHAEGWRKRVLNTPLKQKIGILASAAIIAVGVYGSILHRMGDRLLMKHIFHTASIKYGGEFYLLLILGIIGMYVVIGYILGRLLTIRRN